MNIFPQVYISDIKGNILSIKFWAELMTYGYEDVIKRIIAAYNLELRNDSTNTDVPIVYATNITTFTEKPKEIEMENHLLSMKLALERPIVMPLIPNALDKIEERKKNVCQANCKIL